MPREQMKPEIRGKDLQHKKKNQELLVGFTNNSVGEEEFKESSEGCMY